MLRFLTLLILSLLTGMYANGQILSYEVVRGDKSLGEMKSQRFWENNQEHYHIKSEVEFKLIFSFHVAYAQEEVFQNDTLILGNGYSKLNGATQKETRLKKDKSYYHVKFDGVDNHLHEKAIVQSMSQIHFKEPQDGETFFSQHFGRYVAFEKIGEHRYRMESPDGENEYTYQNGYCTKIKVERDYATYYFIMKPETLARVKNISDTLFHK